MIYASPSYSIWHAWWAVCVSSENRVHRGCPQWMCKRQQWLQEIELMNWTFDMDHISELPWWWFVSVWLSKRVVVVEQCCSENGIVQADSSSCSDHWILCPHHSRSIILWFLVFRPNLELEREKNQKHFITILWSYLISIICVYQTGECKTIDSIHLVDGLWNECRWNNFADQLVLSDRSGPDSWTRCGLSGSFDCEAVPNDWKLWFLNVNS